MNIFEEESKKTKRLFITSIVVLLIGLILSCLGAYKGNAIMTLISYVIYFCVLMFWFIRSSN